MKKLLSIIAVCTLMLSLCSCEKDHIQKNKGWIVTEKHPETWYRENTMRIVNPETLEEKYFSRVDDYFFRLYNLGDTIK